MSPDKTEALLTALFPRTVSATQQGGGFLRRGLAGTLDAASMPGRAYMALADANNNTQAPTIAQILADHSIKQQPTYLQSMAQTEMDPSLPLAERIGGNIFRDPTSILGLGVGKAVGAGAAKLGSGLLGRLLAGGADAAAQTGLQAANQYGTNGSVDPRSLALTAGLMGAGSGIGAGVSSVAPKIAKFWASDQAAAMADRYNNPEGMKKYLNEWINKGKQYGDIPQNEINYLSADEMENLLPPINSTEEKFWLSGKNGTAPPILARGWRYGSPDNPNTSWNFQDQKAEPGVSAMQAFTDDNPNVLGGSYQTFNAKNNKRTIEGWLDQSRTGSDGEPLFTSVRDLGTYPHPDPNFQYLVGGGTQLPTAQQGGLAQALAGKYIRNYYNQSQSQNQ